MKVGRRGFLMAGSAAAGAGMLPAAQAYSAQLAGGRSVTDFGVEPDSKADQTDVLQKAIDALGKANQPIIFPSGMYSVTKLVLPGLCTVLGVQGLTTIAAEHVLVEPMVRGRVSLTGIFFRQTNSSSEEALFMSETATHIADCRFDGEGKIAIKLGSAEGTLQSVAIDNFSGTGIHSASSNLLVSGCRFENCGAGIATDPEAASSVSNNAFKGCGVGIAASGRAVVSGNIVTDARQFGLKLGVSEGKGSILAQGNLLEDCRVGIGVAPSGDEIFVALNLIKGAKDGAIRAFDGEKLVGADLAHESSEAYLNLTLAGNVAR